MIVLYIILALIVLMVLQMAIANNVTPKNLGVTDGKLAPMPKSPNAVSSQSDDPEKQVAPLPAAASAEQTKELLLKVLEEHGARVVEQGDSYIRALYVTAGMKFKDDVEFYIRQAEGVVDFRSASRVGYSDMGVNRQRYEHVLEDYLRLKGESENG